MGKYHKKLQIIYHEETEFNFESEFDHTYLNQLREKIRKNIDTGKKVKVKKDCSWFITLNPKVDKFILLRTILNKILKKSYIDHCLYAFEQRSEILGKFKGLHVHMLVKCNKPKKKSHIIREFQNTGKSILNKESIDIRKVGTEADYDRILSYIKGTKEESKLKKVRNDLEFRKLHKLESLYTYQKVTSNTQPVS